MRRRDVERAFGVRPGASDGEGDPRERGARRRAPSARVARSPRSSAPIRDRVECGVSVGIAASTDALLEQVEGYLAEGYRRIKLKIEPGTDVERVRAVREAHPDILLSVDANAAYTLEDVGVFRELDAFGLLMVEQPLHHEDLWQHAELQRRIRTDVCLDESIRSAADARAAIALGACRIVNVKQGRVGGLLEARRVHDVSAEAGVPVWCGGMLETGIGRATNLALAAMPNFRLPGDTSASRRYFAEDLTEPWEMAPDGTMAVPAGAGHRGRSDPRATGGVHASGSSGSRKSDKTASRRLDRSRRRP